jgi:hypothetical protein
MEAVYSAQNPRDSEGLQVVQPPLRNEGSTVLPGVPQGQYVPQSPNPYPPRYSSPIVPGAPEKPDAPLPAVAPAASRRKFDVSQRLFWLIIIIIILVIGGIIGGVIGGVMAARKNSKSQRCVNLGAPSNHYSSLLTKASSTITNVPEPNIRTTSTDVAMSGSITNVATGPSMPTTTPSKSNGIFASMPTLSVQGATQRSVCNGRVCPRLLSAISLSSSQYSVFGIGTDIALWTYSTNAPGWDSLGGGVTSSPAISVGCTTPMEAFVAGTDRALWHKTWDGSSWTDWSSLGGGLLSPPAVAVRAPGLLDVYVIGTDNALWLSGCSSGEWTTWGSLGGVLKSPLAATSWASNRRES